MRKVGDGEKRKEKKRKEKKITAEIVATNVVASQPPNRDRLRRQPLLPKSMVETCWEGLKLGY